MLINEILKSKERYDISPLKNKCLQFINESNGLPLLKSLPKTYNDIHKVKIRWKKTANAFTETFNNAFKNEHGELRQRAIFANGNMSFQPLNEQEPFYIFPINGYKFTYSKEVTNSNEEYKKTFDAVFEQFGNDKGQAINIITDLLKFTYIKENLHEGIENGSEIIIYNVPYYYAARTAVFEDYNDLLKLIKN